MPGPVVEDLAFQISQSYINGFSGNEDLGNLQLAEATSSSG